VKKNLESGEMRIRMQIAAPRDFEPPRLVEAITRRDGVLRAEVR